MCEGERPLVEPMLEVETMAGDFAGRMEDEERLVGYGRDWIRPVVSEEGN
jgi:hypothetical protein